MVQLPLFVYEIQAKISNLKIPTITDIGDKIYNKIFPIPTEDQVIYTNNPKENSKSKNVVITAKYNIITFLPKNLIEQFQRVANIYFLIISLLQLTTGLSPTGRYGTAIPLILVMLAQMLKDIYEDIFRRRTDSRTNNAKTLAYRNGELKTIKWKQVKVGDILKIQNNEYFPADIMCISCKSKKLDDEGNKRTDICYIETAQLDGETNLKTRKPHVAFKDMTEETIKDVKAKVKCEAPNAAIYKFNGNITVDTQIDVPVTTDHMLLRGSKLMNTEWILGIVIYCGRHTKLRMNARKSPHKRSKIEKLTNYYLFSLFITQWIITILCVVLLAVWNATSQNHWYIFHNYTENAALEVFKSVITFFILFNNFIPISLYVSIEFVKLLQANLFMNNDIGMYFEEKDSPAEVKSSSLNEELGQVEYIFSDKTGTLTCNKMDFLKFGVNGNVYGTGITEIERSNAKRKGLTIENDRPEGFDEDQDFRFYDGEIMTTNEDGSKSYNYFENANLEDSEKITEFFKLLALCHTVIPEKVDGKVKYTSSSPDEEALVKAARELGLEFINRTTSSMTIKIHGSGKEETYTLLNILEFTSTRKRMSVIVRTPEGKLKLLIKGADNVIYERLAADSQHSEKTLKNLEELAEAGLRTLVCAETDIDEEFYVGWNKKFQEALEITDVKIKEKKLEVINAEIEKDLYLVGITAIEDKLQSGVPNTIAELKKGQIKIWVLTGDKQETAKNIGFACDLLNTDMELIELSNTDPKLLSNELENAFFKYKDQAEDIELGLVVDGKKLLVILEDEKLKYIFLKLGTLCSAVVCCRVSPSQKADVVLLVKKNMETITLAIGDGANDVAMIQSAHVGIGIAGKEGLQAANSSDYSFGQFRFLKPLLLIHGRYNYRRVSKIILYSFYKNIVLYITQMWFVFFNAFTGTSVHDKWTVSAYNVFFTFLPIMALGIWDRDISREKVYMFPQLYARGQQNVYFNFWNFLGWVLNAVWHSAVCFFIPMLCLYFPNIYGGLYAGSNPDMYSLGLAIYTSVLLTVTLKAHLEMSSYSFWQIASSLISLALWWLFIFAYGSFYYIYPNYVFLFEETYNILEQWKNMLTLRFYATVLLTTMIACIRDIIHKAGIRFIIPNLYYAVQDTQFYAIQKKLQDPTLDLHEKDILKSRFKRMKEKLINDYPMKQTKPKFTSYAKKMMKKAGITNTTSSSSHRIEETPSDNKNNEEKHHRGFAFSQTENQKSILDMYYKMKKRSTL
mmetsp:Transcript_5502/g.8124  ORF Transcript_5502/g.8124 Transcript_5502/m.8124 type:complete len:1247 (-) Transcript_5502:43-3783(-)